MLFRSLPGIAPATALALLPDIHLIERQIRQESAALHGLAQWALQFTPQVSVQHCASDNTQAGLLLDIGASLTLFGGLGALITRVRAGVTDQGLHARLACAPTPAGAWMLARSATAAVAVDAGLAATQQANFAFYANHLLSRTGGLARTITEGAASVLAMGDEGL